MVVISDSRDKSWIGDPSHEVEPYPLSWIQVLSIHRRDRTPKEAPEKQPQSQDPSGQGDSRDEETPEYPVIYLLRIKGIDNKVGLGEEAEFFKQIGKLKIELE